MLSPKSVCIGILTCPKRHARLTKFLSIYTPQFDKLGLQYYILLANPSLTEEYKITGNTFEMKCVEAYEVLAHKLVIFYDYIYSHTDFKYVFKVDEGCKINVSKMLDVPTHDYFGALMKPTSKRCHRNKCLNPIYNKIDADFRHDFHTLNIPSNKLDSLTNILYAGGGYGYGLSRKALSFIVQYKSHILQLGLSYEDILFGQIMFLSDIKVQRYCFGGYHKIKI